MTTTEIKNKLKEMEIDIPAFEEELDLESGELEKDEWSGETIEKIKAELKAVWDVEI